MSSLADSDELRLIDGAGARDGARLLEVGKKLEVSDFDLGEGGGFGELKEEEAMCGEDVGPFLETDLNLKFLTTIISNIESREVHVVTLVLLSL